jgi:hypothetical protein
MKSDKRYVFRVVQRSSVYIAIFNCDRNVVLIIWDVIGGIWY